MSNTATREKIATLLPEIAARSAEFEAARRVAPDMVDKLKKAGAFRMMTPRAYGGDEFQPVERLPILEDIAAADASTAWTVAIGSDAPLILSRAPEKTFAELYRNGPDTISAGGAAPTGTADIVEGGFKVSGRWAWSSGCLHADWLVGNCVVREDGKPRAGMVPGQPELRMMIFARDQVEIMDTWRVSGLRATGSNDIAVKDLFVPNDRSLDFLLGHPFDGRASLKGFGVQSSSTFAAIALGLAQGALNDVIAMATASKQRLWAASRMAETPLVQYRIGHAETTLRSARHALYAQMRLCQAELDAIPNGLVEILHPVIKATSATMSWVVQTAAGVVDTAYHLGGGSSLQETSTLQRRFRDVHALTQHVSLSDAFVTRHGAGLVGVQTGL